MPVLEEEFRIDMGVDVGMGPDATEVVVSYGKEPGKFGHVWIIRRPKSALERVVSEEDPFNPPPQK